MALGLMVDLRGVGEDLYSGFLVLEHLWRSSVNPVVCSDMGGLLIRFTELMHTKGFIPWRVAPNCGQIERIEQ